MNTPTSPFSADDQGMQRAIEQARRTLPEFFRHYSDPLPHHEYFLIKALFETEQRGEHIWVANVDASVSPLVGIVANETSFPGLKFMEPVSFRPEQITDWMIIENGYMVGGFTNQVAMSRMTEVERAEYLASLPYKVRGYEENAA